MIPMHQIYRRNGLAGTISGIGQVGYLDGKPIVHTTIRKRYRLSDGSIGIRGQLLNAARTAGAQRIYVYDSDAKYTFFANTETILNEGVPGVKDEYGETLNLAPEWWYTFSGKVRFDHAPEDEYVIYGGDIPRVSTPKDDLPTLHAIKTAYDEGAKTFGQKTVGVLLGEIKLLSEEYADLSQKMDSLMDKLRQAVQEAGG